MPGVTPSELSAHVLEIDRQQHLVLSDGATTEFCAMEELMT